MKVHQDNYLRGDRWYAAHKHTSMCYMCDKQAEKKDLIVLYYRAPTYNSHRVLARLCPDCLKELADELDVTLPEDL